MSSDAAKVDVSFSLTCHVPITYHPPPAREAGPMGEPAPELHIHRPPEPLPGQQALPFAGNEAASSPTAPTRPSVGIAGSASPPTANAGAGRLPTLREAWERWWAPERPDLAKATLSKDRTALDRWESACRQLAEQPPTAPARQGAAERDGSVNPVALSDPPLETIDRELLGRVLGVWRQQHSVSPTTLGNWLGTVRKVLQAAVERDALDRLPRFPPLPKGRRKVKGYAGPVRIEEVDALYRAAGAAHWPRLYRCLPRQVKDRCWWLEDPAVWWRTWLVVFWVYGLRTEDVIDTKGGAKEAGLRWSELHREPRCPLPEIETQWSCGWTDIVPGKTEDTKGKPIIWPLHPVAWRHLKLFLPAEGAAAKNLDGTRVFPHGSSRNDFYRALKAIKRAAGVSDDVYISAPKHLAGRSAASRSIRKGAASNWERVAPGVGPWMLGHESPDTNKVFDAYYLDVLGKVMGGIDDLPLPESFRDASLLPKAQGELPAG